MKDSNSKIVIIHNIIAPYKIVLFNELAKIIPNLTVIFVSERESRRDWYINYSKINFDYTLLFKGAIDDVGLIKMAKKTLDVLNQLQPNSLVICDYSKIFGWISLLWGRINKSKLVFWLDSTKDDRQHYFPKEQIKQYFLKHFDLFLSPGSKTKDYLMYMKAGEGKIVTTGYAVDNDFYLDEKEKIKDSYATKAIRIVRTNNNFLFVGRLSQEKNIFLLLKAFLKIANINIDWGLIVIGDGPQMEQIKSFIKENRLTDRIFLFGFVQQAEIVKYYVKSDVFILPSISEPWGLVVNEALLCGLPVIVSNKCGCAHELVKEGKNGFTFNPDSQAELELLMQRFIEKKINLNDFGGNSLEIIKEHSPQNVALKIYKAFQQYNILPDKL